MDLPCRKINVFIGEPNSGKSNILEALALMSPGSISMGEISKEILRYQSIADLFYDSNINKPICVYTDQMDYRLSYAMRENGIPENEFHLELKKESENMDLLRIAHDGKINPASPLLTASPFKFYQYKSLSRFQIGYLAHLAPPFGENLPGLLLSNETYRNWVSEFFESKGFTLTLKPAENEISISKFVNKSIYSYPYFSASETLQRIVFYIMAIKSNQDSILLFDEPESNTFPFYTKFLAERIALDASNQFFVTTHNPYLLLNLIEKTPVDQISINVVKMKNYETEVTPLTQEQLEQVLELNSDVFFNLDQITDGL